MRSVKNKISDSINRVNKEKEKKSETPQNDKKHQQTMLQPINSQKIPHLQPLTKVHQK